MCHAILKGAWSAYDFNAMWVHECAACRRLPTVTMPGYNNRQKVPNSVLIELRCPSAFQLTSSQ
jgi:hypothetical protein